MLLTPAWMLLFMWAPPKGHKVAKPPPDPPFPDAAAKAKIECVLGGEKAIADWKGKVVLLSVVGRDPADRSGAISEPIGIKNGSNPDLVRVTVVDLNGFYTVLHPMIRNRARHDYDLGEEALPEHFKKANAPFHPYNHNTLLLDFAGDMAKALGIDKTIADSSHIYVINRKGGIAWQMSKGQYTDDKARELAGAAVTRALTSK